jgi:hypothetical protein
MLPCHDVDERIAEAAYKTSHPHLRCASSRSPVLLVRHCRLGGSARVQDLHPASRRRDLLRRPCCGRRAAGRIGACESQLPWRRRNVWLWTAVCCGQSSGRRVQTDHGRSALAAPSGPLDRADGPRWWGLDPHGPRPAAPPPIRAIFDPQLLPRSAAPLLRSSDSRATRARPPRAISRRRG